MKLELKHLAAYYAHDLKVQYYDDERGRMEICEMVELRKDECTIDNSQSQWEVNFYEFMPILRPLSDLNKDNWKEINTIFDFSSLKDYDINFIPYSLFEFLIKNHFDVFGLINIRCAIDINTIEL